MIQVPNNINLNMLSELARQQPKYTKVLLGIQEIDIKLKQHIRNIVTDTVSNPEEYFLKTELMNQCYIINLFYREKQLTVGCTYPFADLLIKCSKKTIHMDLQIKVKKMILKFEEKNLYTDKINWIN